MKKLFSLLFAISFIEIFACSIVHSPPDKFDPNEYIFTGKVIEHVFSIGVNPQFEYNGILVEIKEEIYIPGEWSKFYEIYPLSLGADCSLGPRDKLFIENYFPIGSEIRVVAKLTNIKFQYPISSHIKLEVSPVNSFKLSQNLMNIPDLYSTRESVYNYERSSREYFKKFSNKLIDSLRITERKQQNIITSSVYSLIDFELRKDLYRLHKLNDDREKAKIIYRLKNFKYLGALKMLNIIDEYIKDEIIKDRLLGSIFIINENPRPIEYIIR